MLLRELYPLRQRTYEGKAHRWDDLFGVEFEIENLTAVPEIPGWTVKNDGSLRNGYEYVLLEPLGGIQLESAIHRFYGAGFKYTNGPRTSTHIHVNATDMTLDQLRSMIVLTYTIEDALFGVIGEARKWAGYAMPLSEMEAARMRVILSSDNMFHLQQQVSPSRNQERYYGFNTCVRRHGTVEFRHFPGGPSKEELHSWLDLVIALKRAAMRTPVAELLDRISSPDELIRFLEASLPREWVIRLMNHNTVDQMMTHFSEVSALCSEEEQAARRQAIVFAVPPLVDYTCKHILSEDAAKMFRKKVDQLQAMTVDDWQINLEEAVRLTLAGDGKQSKNKPALADVEPNQWYAYEELNVRDVPEQAFAPRQEENHEYVQRVVDRVRREQEQRNAELQNQRAPRAAGRAAPPPPAALRFDEPDPFARYGNPFDLPPRPVLRGNRR